MVWSAQLGAELRRALNRSGHDQNLGNRVWRQLNLAFRDNLKELKPWTPLGLPDAGDEHVAQLAIQQCAVLSTFNLRDFPGEHMEPLEVLHPDAYFLRAVRHNPAASLQAIQSMMLARSQVQVTEVQLIEAFARNRLPATAEYLKWLNRQ